jgi:hypothetical protein
MAEFDKPVEEDLRVDDQDYNPGVEPQSAKAWLNLLRESEDAFEDWNTTCDNLDRLYASLERLATSDGTGGRVIRDRQYQMFWANCEVLKPSIYAKQPVPVVAPKFKDRRPVYQAASEVMERCCTVAFDLTRINDLMLLVRDDLSMISRGVAWCRYETGKDDDDYYDSERVCIDFKGRRDFLHSISRNWREVTWVAAASYLTRSEARERFHPYSGDEYQNAEYKVDKDSERVGGADRRERAAFWEIWSKGDRRVLWVSEGCEKILDEDDPHLNLQNFFPCPKPAYGTVQRGSLIPVPDVMQYRDQLDEINMLTARIHALSDALQVKGFYPAGGGELADAITTAININTSSTLLVPIANWAAFGGTKDVLIWLPIDQIATTITQVVMLRKQVIDDIYQITGLADIMRGDTDPNETLGAQQIKTQYGTTRIRDKQQELVRLARDVVEITSEIITEKFKDATIVEMSQTQLPRQRDIEKQAAQIMQQAQAQAQSMTAALQGPQAQQPQAVAAAPADPQQPDPKQQIVQQLQALQTQTSQQLQQLQQQPTIEQVLKFLKDNRAKSFVLDIETDSTIMADENAEKAARTEFVQVLGNLLPQLSQMIMGDPATAEFCGEVLKFATAPFRVGRSLDGAIDELVEQMKAKGAQGKGDDPTTAMGKIQLQIEQMKQQTAQQKNQQDMQIAQAKLAQEDQHKQMELQNQQQIARMKMSGDAQGAQVDMAVQGQKMQESQQAHQAQLAANQQKMMLERQKADLLMQQHTMKQADFSSRVQERRAAQQFKMNQPQGRPV